MSTLNVGWQMRCISLIRMLSTITATDRDASSGLLFLKNATSVDGKISTNRVRDMRRVACTPGNHDTSVR